MKTYNISKEIFGGLLAITIGLFSINPAKAQTLIDLGTLGGTNSYGNGINDSGQVVGYSDLSGNSIQSAFIYSGGIMSPLGTWPDDSYANEINASGQVVGYFSTTLGGPKHAFLYSTVTGTMTDLGTLGGPNSRGFGINASGQAVGFTNTGAGTHAFLYSGGTMTDLGSLAGPSGSSSASGINTAGQIVGETDTGSAQEPFLYSGGTMTSLGSFAGTPSTYGDAYAINNVGQIVGWSNNLAGKPNAFLYSGGSMSDLSTLGGSESYATSINDSGLIVGYSYTAGDLNYHAFVYSSATGLEDLNALDASLMVTGTGTTVGFTSLTLATGVNNSGMITGSGTYWDGSSLSTRAFLLSSSVPEPSTWALMMCGLGLLFFWHSRRSRV